MPRLDPLNLKGVEDRETIAYGLLEDIFVIVSRYERVDEREWQACIREAIRMRRNDRVLLVPVTVLPDVGRRHDLVQLHEKHGPKLAVMSDLPATHRVVTVLKWAGMNAEGFSVDDLDGMLAFFDRTGVRARMSSTLGPYLDRSWLVDPSMLLAERRRTAHANR